MRLRLSEQGCFFFLLSAAFLLSNSRLWGESECERQGKDSRTGEGSLRFQG